MKRYAAFIFIPALLLALLVSCTGKTPDVIAAEEAAAVTLENMTWTIPLEGAGAAGYSREDAEKHPLTRVISSISRHTENDPNGVGSFTTSVMVEGITLREFLTDVGAADASRITVAGTDPYGERMEFTIEGELLSNEKIVIGWIRNKTELLYDSKTHVGLFPANTVADCPYCPSVEKIVIE